MYVCVILIDFKAHCDAFIQTLSPMPTNDMKYDNFC
jgi:hypothetical protein